MQAIILAAGMGKRLGAATKENTKCMVEVNGERLIDRFLRQLSSLGCLRKVVIVIGYKGENLRNHIAEHYDGDLEIEFIENPVYDKTNNIYSLWLAKERLCEDDTLLLESDLIVEDRIFDLVVKTPHPNLAVVDRYESWMDGTMVRIDEDCQIVNFVPKAAFRYEDVDVYYKTVNIYKFSKEFSRKEYVPFLEAYTTALGLNEYYEQVLRVVTLLHGTSLRALPLNGEKWYEIDDIQDLDIASTIFSENEVKYKEYHKRYGGYWRFPNLLDYCYLVNPFFPTKRLKDELKASFDALLTNYPSGLSVNSLLAAKYFHVSERYITVGNGAAELIKSLTETIGNSRVGVIYPTFDEYPNRMPGAELVTFTSGKPDFRYDARDLMEYYADKRLDYLLLINPDNPSGNYIEKEGVIELAQWCEERGIRLVVDESFVDFAYDFGRNTLLDDEILERFPKLSVMKSISKSYGVPGLRLGVFATSDTSLLERVKKGLPIWNINSFGEYYMQIYGKYEGDYLRGCKKFIDERERFGQQLSEISYLHVMPSQANYFLCEVTDRYTSSELTQLLISRNVLISNCGRKRNMSGRNLVRLAVRSSEDNDRLIEILKELEK